MFLASYWKPLPVTTTNLFFTWTITTFFQAPTSYSNSKEIFAKIKVCFGIVYRGLCLFQNLSLKAKNFLCHMSYQQASLSILNHY